jgi:hypothetical protein
MSKWLSDWGQQVAVRVGAAVTVAGLGWVAYVGWPPLWAWLQSGEGEAAHYAAFILTLCLLWLWRIAPLWPLPIRVTPFSDNDPLAVLTVRNLGRDGVFYASADVLAVRITDEPGASSREFRPVSLRPTWGPKDEPVASIRRYQVADLRLAWFKRDEAQMVTVGLTDRGGKNETFRYKSGTRGWVQIDLKVTVARKERRAFLRLLPCRRYVGWFTVEGLRVGRLAVRRTSRIGWWSNIRFRRSEDPPPSTASEQSPPP